jgi:translation initiation factor IF-3
VVVKEIKLRPKTDDHDLNFKLKHIRRFLSEGNKCKLAIVFRGREIVHPETGHSMLEQVVKDIADIAMVEQKATMEGRRMVMLVGPKGGVIRRPTDAPAMAPPATAAAATPTASPPPAPVPAAPARPPAAPAARPAAPAAPKAPPSKS